MRSLRFALLALAVLWLAGCKDPYGTAAKLGQDVAISVNQADKAVDGLRVQGAITADEERDILGYLNSLNALDGQYMGCVRAAHGTSLAGGFTGCAETLAEGMGDPATLAALRVANPASQQKVMLVSQGIVTLVSTTIAALGGK